MGRAKDELDGEGRRGHVPALDGRLAVLPAELAHRGGAQDEQPAFGTGEAEPPGGQDPQDMAVGEDQGPGATVEAQHPPHDTVRPRRYVGGLFAPRPWAGPDGPTRVMRPYFVDGEPLQVSIVPLRQVLVDFRPEPGQLSRVPRPLARAGQDELEERAPSGHRQGAGPAAHPLPSGAHRCGWCAGPRRSTPFRRAVPATAPQVQASRSTRR